MYLRSDHVSLWYQINSVSGIKSCISLVADQQSLWYQIMYLSGIRTFSLVSHTSHSYSVYSAIQQKAKVSEHDNEIFVSE